MELVGMNVFNKMADQLINWETQGREFEKDDPKPPASSQLQS